VSIVVRNFAPASASRQDSPPVVSFTPIRYALAVPIHRIETHCHTNVVSPCGRLSPKELAVAYSRAGYSAIVITDHLVHSLPLFTGVSSWRKRVHRYFSGYRAVRTEAAPLGLTVLPGFELTFTKFPGRDFLVYGFDEETLADAGNV